MVTWSNLAEGLPTGHAFLSEYMVWRSMYEPLVAITKILLSFLQVVARADAEEGEAADGSRQ